MILDMFSEEDIKVVVSYLPVWEFFFSMHVLSNPEHHVSRQKWVQSKEKCLPELVKEIRNLKTLTNEWILIIDSEKWSEIRQMEIIEMIRYFRKKNIYQWNHWVKETTGNEMTRKERDRILNVMEAYYETVFRKEEMILRPYLIRVIQNEKRKCQAEGLWNWIGKIHTRLQVEETEIIYLKNHEFKYKKKELNTVFLTVSTFVYPHLWLFKHRQELEVVKGVIVESIESDIPEDLVQIFKVLGDKTRLRIIKLLMQNVCTTQELAQKLEISEAAVSKHLQIMWKADLVHKNKKGFFVEYEFKEDMTSFYKDFGVGKLGLHKAFRVAHDENGVQIVPITKIAHVHLDDLVGYELAKKKLIENTEAFVQGRKANNCLLFGDAGTGKSSSIKGILNEYYDQGLRIIEVYKHQFQDLNDVIAQVKNRNYRFIIYMDDLSFEEFEIEYKYLKAVIEGGLERKPENVLIYATSNRRHLIREKFSDKEERRDDLHTSDTVQEKLSLAYRFGLKIYFGSPSKKEFQNIVRVLADKHGITMSEEELFLKANQWELQYGGLSGRTAQQFIDHLLGQERKDV